MVHSASHCVSGSLAEVEKNDRNVGLFPELRFTGLKHSGVLEREMEGEKEGEREREREREGGREREQMRELKERIQRKTAGRMDITQRVAGIFTSKCVCVFGLFFSSVLQYHTHTHTHAHTHTHTLRIGLRVERVTAAVIVVQAD